MSASTPSLAGFAVVHFLHGSKNERRSGAGAEEVEGRLVQFIAS